MIAETAVPTLLEDWQLRRAHLAADPHEANNQAAALLQVLDYLIRRYEGTDAARKPARVAAPHATVLNTRAMVVHHHLWSGKVAGVKTREQARERMASVLHRMEESAHLRTTGEIAAPSDSEDNAGEGQRICMPWAPGRVRTLNFAFRFRVGQCWAIRRCLAVSPYLPIYAVRFLTDRAIRASEYDIDEVTLLARCGSPCVYELTAEALGERIEKSGADTITEELATQLRNPRLQRLYCPESLMAAQFRLRERLASEDRAERMRKISVLALVGDLHDISLLTDLATVCRGDGASAEEHGAFVAAVEAISRRPVMQGP